jgi:hypothetical protein
MSAFFRLQKWKTPGDKLNIILTEHHSLDPAKAKGPVSQK